jgi:hypothetical protein
MKMCKVCFTNKAVLSCELSRDSGLKEVCAICYLAHVKEKSPANANAWRGGLFTLVLYALLIALAVYLGMYANRSLYGF